MDSNVNRTSIKNKSKEDSQKLRRYALKRSIEDKISNLRSEMILRKRNNEVTDLDDKYFSTLFRKEKEQLKKMYEGEAKELDLDLEDIINGLSTEVELKDVSDPLMDEIFEFEHRADLAMLESFQAMKIMNIAVVLRNTLSNDQNIREQASRSLQSLEEENLAIYSLLLCQELANEQSDMIARAAAGIALKNMLKARDLQRRSVLVGKWIGMDIQTKSQVKAGVLFTLASNDDRAASAAAQVIEAIANIELPRKEWPELMPKLLENMTNPNAKLRKATLEAIGFICEEIDVDVLVEYSDSILTAVIQGVRKEEPSPDVRCAAVNALFNSLEFVEKNFENEHERNFIMQTLMEAATSVEENVSSAAFECLVKIMQLYYKLMLPYMNAGLFNLTLGGMQSKNEKTALQAIEFWSTVSEVEIDIQDSGSSPMFSFALTALEYVIPVLLQLLSKQNEEDDEDEWNIPMAAGTCLSLFANCVGDEIVGPKSKVLEFVQANIGQSLWRSREAAVMAFGCILEGPTVDTITPYVQKALPLLLNMMNDSNATVKDTTAWVLGRITELNHEAFDAETMKQAIQYLLNGLRDSPKIASNCAWALMNLAERVGGDDLMTHFFEVIAQQLLQAADRADANEGNLRTAVYEALSSLICNSSDVALPLVKQLLDLMLARLNQTLFQESGLVNQDDRMHLTELQSCLCTVVQNIVKRLEEKVSSSADTLMEIMFSLLHANINRSSPVIEDVLLVIGVVTTAIELNFEKYTEKLVYYLQHYLGQYQEVQLCITSIGLIGDLCRCLSGRVVKYSDQWMKTFFALIGNPSADRDLRKYIISAFGDVAMAIEIAFLPYLEGVMGVLEQAGNIRMDLNDYDELDFYLALQESVLEAYTNIIQGLKGIPNVSDLVKYVPQMIQLIKNLKEIPGVTDVIVRGSVGLLGDIADAMSTFVVSYLQNETWIVPFIKSVKADAEASDSTKDVASWSYSIVLKLSKT